MDNIDQLLNDFYSKYTGASLTPEKLSTIKSTYGNNYDVLLKDLYSKYNQPLDDTKLKTIKDTYKLSAPTFDFDTNKNVPGANKDLGFRNNNPLNLRPVGQGGFRKFNTLEEGYQAALKDINYKLSGKSPAFNGYLKRNNKSFDQATIKDLITVWAPPSENSAEGLKNYYKVVGQQLGIDPETTHVSKVNPKDLVVAMSRVESPLSYQALMKSREAGYTAEQVQQTMQPQQAGQPQTDPRSSMFEQINKKVEKQYQDAVNSNKKVNYGTIRQISRGAVKKDVLDQYFKDGILKLNQFTDQELNYLYGEDDYVSKLQTVGKEQGDYLNKQLKDEGIFESIGDWIGKNAFQTAKALGFGDVLDTKGGKININRRRFLQDAGGNFGSIDDNYLTPQEIMELKSHPLSTEPNNPNEDFNVTLREIQSVIAADEKAKFKSESNGFYKKLQLGQQRMNGLINDIENKTYKGVLDDVSDLNAKIEAKTATQEEQQRYQQLVQQLQSTGNIEELQALQQDLQSANESITSLTGKYGNLKKLNMLEDARHVDNEAYRKQLSNTSSFLNSLFDGLRKTATKFAEIPKDLAQLAGTGIEAVTGLDVNALDSRYKENILKTDEIRSSKQKRSAVDNYIKIGDKQVVFEDGVPSTVYGSDGYEISDPVEKTKLLKQAQIQYRDNPSALQTNKFRFDGVLYGIEETAPDLINIFTVGGMARGFGMGALKAAAKSGKVSGVTGLLKTGAVNIANSPRFLEAMSMVPVFAGQTMDDVINSGKAATAGDVFLATSAKLAEEMLAEAVFAGPVGKLLTGKGITTDTFKNLTKGKVEDVFKRLHTGKISAKDIGRELKNIGVELGKDAGFEGLEEALVEAIDPFVNDYLNYAINTSFDVKMPTTSDILSSFAVGAGSGALMGGARAIGSLIDIKSNIGEHYKGVINNIANNSLDTMVNGEMVKNPDAFKIHAQTLLDKKKITEQQFNQVTGAIQAAADRSKHLQEPRRFTSKIGKAADKLLGLTEDDKNNAFNSLYRNVAFEAEMLKIHPDATSSNPVIAKSLEQRRSQYENILSDLNVNHANGILSGITPSTLIYGAKKKDGYTSEDLSQLKSKHETFASELARSKYSDEVKAQLLELRLKNALNNIKSSKENLKDTEKEAIKADTENNTNIEKEIIADEDVKIEDQELNERKQKIVNDLTTTGNSTDPQASIIQQERLEQLRDKLESIEDGDDLLTIEQEYTTPDEKEYIQKYKESKENRISGDKTKADKLQSISLDPEEFETSFNQRYSINNGQINNQELYDQDKIAISDAIQTKIDENLPEELKQEYAPYIQELQNAGVSLKDMIDPSIIEQLPEPLQQVVVEAIEEYYNSKNSNVVPAVISSEDNEFSEDEDSDFSENTNEGEYFDTIGNSETSALEDPDTAVPSIEKDNIMSFNSGYVSKDGYYVEFYDSNGTLVNSAIVSKEDVKNRIFDSQYILDKYSNKKVDGSPLASDYRIVENPKIDNDFKNANQAILKLQPSDIVYYEVEKSNFWNANKNPNKNNLSIYNVVYLKDNKVVTRDTEGATRVVVGQLSSNVAMNIRELAWQLFTDPNSGNIINVGNTRVNKVVTRVDHQFNKKRDVRQDELNADNLFVVEVPFNDKNFKVNDGKSTNSLIFKNRNLESESFPNIVPTSWIGSVVMKLGDKLFKLHTKTIAEVPELVTEVDSYLKKIETAKNPDDRVAAWESLLDVVRYRTPASNFDTKVKGQNVADAEGVGPMINYFPDSKKWVLDGKKMKSREDLVSELSKRRVNINPALFNDPKYVRQLHKYLQTDLAESIDNSYRTAPTLYLDLNFNPSNEVTSKVSSDTLTSLQVPIETSSKPTFKEFFKKLNKSVANKVTEIQNNSKFIKLNDEGTGYINTNNIDPKTNKPREYQRVTDYIKDTPFDESDNKLLDSSKAIGNKIDAIGRDIFNDQLRKPSDYDLSDNVELFNKVVSKFNGIKNSMAARNEYVIPGRIMVYNDSLGVAGEVDLMTVDSNGNFRIYDIKTMRGQKLTPNKYGEIAYESNKVFEKTGKTKKDGSPEYKIVPGKTQDSTKQKHQKQVSVYSILTTGTHNVPIIGAGIIPFEVDYNPGDTKVSDVRPSKIIKLDLITSISEILPSKGKEEELLPSGISPSELNNIIAQAYQNMRQQLGDEDISEPVNVLSSKSTEEVVKEEKAPQIPNDLPSVKVVKKTTRKNKNLLKFSEKSYVSKADDDKAISWFKERLGEVDIEISDEAISQLYNTLKLGGGKLWGAFHNASVILASDASSKVTRHEAFHVVFNLFLNDKQREQVLDEAFQRFGKELGITKEAYELAKKQGKAVDTLFSLEQQVIRPGVEELFKSNPELAAIGTPEQYSQYLDTIFPDSKVKDIVYHGTPDGRFDSFDVTKAGKTTFQSTQGIYFTDSRKTADFYAEGSIDFSQFESLEEYQAVKTAKVFSVILNAKNLKLVDSPQAQKKQGDAILRTIDKIADNGFVGEPDFAYQYIVFEKEQIHILGSKQDIEGFKKFVNTPSARLKTEQAAYYKTQSPLIQLEEKLSDLFEDYKDGLSLFSEKNKTKYPAITKFFDKIYKFLFNQYNVLQSYLSDKVTIDGLFYQLENNILGRDFLGRRKSSVRELFTRNVDNVLGKNPFTKLTNNWSSQDISRYAQFINKDLLNEYLLSNYNSQSISDILDNNKNLSITEIMRNFRSDIDNVVANYKQELIDSEIDFDNNLIDEIINELKNNKDFERIVLINLLPSRGITMSTSKNVDDGDQENNSNDNEDEPIDATEDTVDLEGWQKNDFSISPLNRMSAKLREFLSNIPIRDENGEMVSNGDTGQVDYYSYEKIHGKLLQELSDSVDVNEMIDKLNILKEEFTWAKNIYKDIYGEELYLKRKDEGTLDLTINDINNLSSLENGDILTYIWGTIADQSNRDFTFILEDNNEVKLIKSNLRNIISDLTNRSISYFERNHIKNSKLTYDPNKFNVDVTTLTIEEIKKLLNDLGFIVENDVISNILKNNSQLLQIEFETIYENLSRYPDFQLNSKGDHNIRYINEEGKFKKTEGDPIQGIAVLLYRNQLNSEQRNIFTLGGKTKYNHGVSNYLNRTFAYIKKKTNEFVNSRTEYKGSPILMHSSLDWYQDIQGRIENFDLIYVEGFKESFKFKGKEYSEMFEQDIEALNFNIFSSSFDDKNKLAYFTSPVFSDSSNKAALKQQVFDVDSKYTGIKDKLLNIALVELQRINVINSNKKAIDKKVSELLKENPDISPVELELVKQSMRTGFYNLDNNGDKFQFLTFLNTIGLDLNNISGEILVNKNGLQTFTENAEKKILQAISDKMEENYNKYKQKLIDNGTIIQNEDGSISKSKESNFSNKVNDKLLRTYYYNQFYYNSVFQIVFSGDLAHYKAKLEDTVVTEAQKREKQVDSPYSRGLWGSKTTHKVLFLKDIEIPTQQGTIDNIINSLGYNPTDAAVIRKALESNNITDAATVHTLSRRKEIMKAFNLWKPYHEELFNRLEKGTPLPSDLKEVLQPIKPFYYGLIPLKDNSSNAAHLVPLQMKNSEMVLLPSVAYLNKNGKVDIPNYDKSSPEITDFSKYQYPDLAKTLYTMNRNSIDTVLFESAVKASHFKFADFNNLNDNLVQENFSEVPNEFWGIQMEVPSKHEDAKVLIGSQVRKIIMGDLDPNLEVGYQLTDNTKTKILELFNNDENNSDYNDIINVLQQNSFRGNSIKDLLDITYELDIRESLNDVKKFTDNSEKVLEYLRDKALEKEPSKHAVDSYELQEDSKPLVPLELAGKKNEGYLNSLYKRVSKIKQFGAALVNMTSFGFINRFGDVTQDQLSIVHKYDDDGNIIGIDYIEAAIPANSKIFYQFADKYGNIDIEKIREIDPTILDAIFYRIPTEGKYSIFPIRVTKILPPNAGGKIILPKEATSIAGLDFDVDKMYGLFKKFKRTFNPDILNELSTSLNELYNESFTNEEYSYLINELLNSDLDDLSMLDYLDPKYDSVLPLLDVKLKEYINKFGNKVFDTIQVIPPSLSNKDSRANLRLDISLDIARSKEFARDFYNVGSKQVLVDLVSNKVESNRSLVDPRIQENIAAKNVIGKRLIGIFANSNAFHNLIQGRSNLRLSENAKPVVFDGVVYDTFNGPNNDGLDSNGNKISKSLATLLFASTEDAKQPVLAALNINPYTAGLQTTMVRLGIPLTTVLEYTSSPILLSLVKYISTNNINSLSDLLNNESKLKQALGTNDTSYVEELKNLVKISDDLLSIERAAKVDTGNIGPELSNVIEQLNKIQDVNVKSRDASFTIEGVQSVLPDWFIDGSGNYKITRKSNIRQLNAYTQILIDEVNQMSPYFNYFNQAFNLVRNEVGKFSESGRVNTSNINLVTTEIYNAITQKILQSKNVDIYKLITTLPNKFVNHPLLKQDRYNELRNAFNIDVDHNNIEVLQLAIKPSQLQAEAIKNQIESLILETQADPNDQVGKELAIYSMLLGFKFSKGGFYHLIPPSFFKVTPEGRQIRSVINSTKDISSKYFNSYTELAETILKNNFTKLVKRVKPDDVEKLKNNKYSIKNSNNLQYVYIRVKNNSGGTTPTLLKRLDNSDAPIYYPIEVNLSGRKIKDYIQDTKRADSIKKKINEDTLENSLDRISISNLVNNLPDTNKNHQQNLNEITKSNYNEELNATYGIQMQQELENLKEDFNVYDQEVDFSEIRIPDYKVNRELKNIDGSKKLASTSAIYDDNKNIIGNVIYLNPVKSVEEFYDYIQGKVDSFTSRQKQIVLERLTEKGWDLNRIKNLLNTKKLVDTFLILHEQDHIAHNDRDVYWVNGRSIEDMISEDKIQIETRASINALMLIQAAKDKNLPCQNTGISL